MQNEPERTPISREEFLTDTITVFTDFLPEIEHIIANLPKPVHYHDKGLYGYLDEVYVLVNRIRHMAEHRMKK